MTPEAVGIHVKLDSLKTEDFSHIVEMLQTKAIEAGFTRAKRSVSYSDGTMSLTLTGDKDGETVTTPMLGIWVARAAMNAPKMADTITMGTF